VDDYEVICACGGAFTVRLGRNRYGCVRCTKEVDLPPLWLDLDEEDFCGMLIEYSATGVVEVDGETYVLPVEDLKAYFGELELPDERWAGGA